MGKIKPGSKMNSYLNGEWATHGRPWGKRKAARKRRSVDKKIISDSLAEMD